MLDEELLELLLDEKMTELLLELLELDLLLELALLDENPMQLNRTQFKLYMSAKAEAIITDLTDEGQVRLVLDYRSRSTREPRGVSELTGWAPRHSVADTVSDIFRWLEDHRDLLEPVLGYVP